MALIPCPNCGKEISDRAEKCPACGHILIEPIVEEKPVIKCPECGVELEEGVTVCPNCGCPIEVEPEVKEPEAQKVEITKVHMDESSKKKIIIAIVSVCIIALIAIVGINAAKKNAAANAVEQYKENINSASSTMLLGAISAEDAGNLMHKVWSNAIYKKSDSETDKYTKNGYSFVSDFNDAIVKLYADSDYQSKIDSIKANQELVKNIMKDLSSPPDEMRDAYDAVKDLYDAYLDLTNLVVSPTGSLQTFTSNFNDADSDFAKCYDAMDMYKG